MYSTYITHIPVQVDAYVHVCLIPLMLYAQYKENLQKEETSVVGKGFSTAHTLVISLNCRHRGSSVYLLQMYLSPGGNGSRGR